MIGGSLGIEKKEKIEVEEKKEAGKKQGCFFLFLSEEEGRCDGIGEGSVVSFSNLPAWFKTFVFCLTFFPQCFEGGDGGAGVQKRAIK